MTQTNRKPEVYNYLKEIGCCNICCLRYYNGRGDDYLDVKKAFGQRGITILDESTEDDECVTKKIKKNVCIACLGLFDEDNLAKILDEIVALPDLAAYDSTSVSTSISVPILLSLRQLSIWISLIKKFLGEFSSSEPPDVHVKEVIKLLVNPKVCKRLNRTFEQHQNGLLINIFFEHENETAELKPLGDVNPQLFKDRSWKPRKFHSEFITRMAFDKNFIPSKIDLEKFVKYVPVPGEIPNNPVSLVKITLLGPTIFVAGRYRKLSRELCQSPWIIKGQRHMESSVQEIIIDEIGPHFGVPLKSINFSSSGREDVDVRCLGLGRPFVLEIPDSRKTTLLQTVAAEMEVAIDKSDKISVQHLQLVKREELSHIKQGEESKKKMYRALCVLKEPATLEVMQKLNISEEFVIEQITPTRVLHRRAHLKRPRSIYSVKAYVDKDNHKMVILDIVTQAGTYVKELIHGEFGRTNPSISSIIGQWIDIVALDVVHIDLDWPEKIDNKKCLIIKE